MQSFLSEILRKAGIPRDQSVLVVCGGAFDRDALLEEGYTAVTISNLDDRVRDDEFAPFAWSFQDAEALSFPDRSFDYCIVHAGLHHCASPHRALLEMYRVARHGVLAFEARDSLMMRMAVRARRVPVYETCAVRFHNFRYGGVRNTCVPNYIYRWTETEVEDDCELCAARAASHPLLLWPTRSGGTVALRVQCPVAVAIGWGETTVGVLHTPLSKAGQSVCILHRKAGGNGALPMAEEPDRVRPAISGNLTRIENGRG